RQGHDARLLRRAARPRDPGHRGVSEDPELMRTNLSRRVALTLALAAASTAFAQPGANGKPAAGAWRVLDSFEVGEGVYVRALKLEEKRNVMWVGTSSGVHEVDLKSLKPVNTFTRKEGLANEYVFSVGVDHAGNKWFGTNAGGVSRYNNGQWKTFFPMHGLADYWGYCFANPKDSTTWNGTRTRTTQV